MTPRKNQRVSVPRSKSGDYLHVAENFRHGAEAARTFEYWNAAGVLIVHAAIAYADAVAIKTGGVKSRGEDHMAAASLLEQVTVLDERGRQAVKRLTRILEQKNFVSYSGETYRQEAVDRLWKEMERFREWAALILER